MYFFGFYLYDRLVSRLLPDDILLWPPIRVAQKISSQVAKHIILEPMGRFRLRHIFRFIHLLSTLAKNHQYQLDSDSVGPSFVPFLALHYRHNWLYFIHHFLRLREAD